MVTIDPDKPIQPIAGTKVAISQSKTQKGAFDAVFQQAIDRKTIKPAKTESTAFVSDIRPVQFATVSQSPANMVVDRVERLIDTMADFQSKLIENGATLKDMHGLVQQMASQSESLAAVSDSIDQNDSLKSIVNQSLMMSSMEIARYNGGHYND